MPAAIALLLAASAPSPVGHWNGRIKLPPHTKVASGSGLAPGATAKTKISLVVNKDHTFTSKVVTEDDPEGQVITGKWTQSGLRLTFFESETPTMGRAFSIEKDGRTMRYQIAARRGTQPPVIVFTR